MKTRGGFEYRSLGRGMIDLSNRKTIRNLLSACVVTLCLIGLAREKCWGERKSEYIGSEACSTCHADVAKKWSLTVHRKTVFNKEESRKGCESCHGPGGPHVAAGGDPSKILHIRTLSAQKQADACLKCHNQEKMLLWQTSRHARAKMSCASCHDPHSLETRSLNSDTEAGKVSLKGLTKTIKQVEARAALAREGSAEKSKALDELAKLKAKRHALDENAKGAETVYVRATEPFLCYSCHKSQEAQSRMPSHHPIVEGKMKCGECHNPHGGPRGMLREESVMETCARCHQEKVGPFTFEHPPVNEDCTTCHKPHGSVQDNLLAQSEPFLCLKCHAGPHSRNATLGSPVTFARYYTECTDCHVTVHGSDRHSGLHY